MGKSVSVCLDLITERSRKIGRVATLIKVEEFSKQTTRTLFCFPFYFYFLRFLFVLRGFYCYDVVKRLDFTTFWQSRGRGVASTDLRYDRSRDSISYDSINNNDKNYKQSYILSSSTKSYNTYEDPIYTQHYCSFIYSLGREGGGDQITKKNVVASLRATAPKMRVV